MYIVNYKGKDMKQKIFNGFIRQGCEDIELVRIKKDLENKYSYRLNLFNAIQAFVGSVYYDDSNPEFWGSISEIKNVNMYAYFSSDECTLEEAKMAFDCRIYGGDLYLAIENQGYSDWTITGYNVSTAMLGGHDLWSELVAHEGEYMHLVVKI